LARIVLNGNGISEYTGSARLHTDDLAFAEFSAPKKIYGRGVRGPLLENLNRQRQIDLSFLTFGKAEKNDAERIKSIITKRAEATKYAVEAVILFERDSRKEAVRLAGKAAQLNPRGFPFLNEISENLILQALAFQKKNDPAGADQYCRTAMELTPAFLPAQAVYGTILTRQRKWAEASAAFRHALKIEPDDPTILNQLAWLLATCPDQAVRNGREALAMALDLCGTEGAQNPNYLRTLCAAYAETGQFSRAVQTAQTALKLARDEADLKLMDSLETLLKYYQEGNPFYQ
jgi:tetratricopeptide (TPR) repeat protein